jgi:pimeloyl-ACP methyl ester carboxylesterase
MNGDVAIAYEIVGDGSVDLLYLAPINNLEIVWENPYYARFVRRLTEFSRVILMDRRGTGLSDRFSPNDLPPIEDLADDILAVLDAAGSQRAVLFGFSDAGAQCAMVAATRPDRVAGLVLYAASASGKPQVDYQGQWTDEEWDSYLELVRTKYGTEEFGRRTLEMFAPSHVDDGRIFCPTNGDTAFARITRPIPSHLPPPSPPARTSVPFDVRACRRYDASWLPAESKVTS